MVVSLLVARKRTLHYCSTPLFALPGFKVVNVGLEPECPRRVLTRSIAVEGGGPACRDVTGLKKEGLKITQIALHYSMESEA